MANHGAVRLDRVKATGHGNLESLQASFDLDNGAIVLLGDLVSGERELKTPATPTTPLINSDPVVLIASPELTYLAGQTILDFYNAANTPMRGIVLSTGDIVTITNNMISGAPVLDQYVAPAHNSFLFTVNASEPSTRVFGKIISTTDTIDGQAATVIQILKA